MHRSRQEQPQTQEDEAHLLRNDVLDIDDQHILTETMTILEKFMVLIKRAEGTDARADRGILSDYMTTLNNLIAHVRTWRDDIEARIINVAKASKSDLHLKTCIVNYQTKLDDYFKILNNTPTHYASIVTTPYIKWKYFEYIQKDASSQKDIRDLKSWLLSGKRALNTLWDEYRDLLFENHMLIGSKRRRSDSPSDFERSINMALIYEDDVEEDQLEAWIRQKPFALDHNDTLIAYWLRQVKDKSTHQLARMALDMASIPAMSSECERVFSQSKLLITGQRNSL